MAKLTLSFKDKKLKIYPLTGAELVIGRDPDCGIAIDSLAVQPRHARIVAEADSFRVESLQAEDPARINHQPVTEATLLNDGDQIQIGKHTLSYSSEPASEGVQVNFTSDPRLPTGWLQIMSGAHLGRTIRLDRAMTRLGKTGMESAMIARREDGYYVSHLEGETAPLINDDPIGDRSVRLAAGDRLRIGKLELHFYLDGQQQPTETGTTSAMTPAAPTQQEHRRFTRIPFDAAAVLAKDGHEWHSALIDLSLKGALIQQPKDWDGHSGDEYELTLVLDQDTRIHMEVNIAHIEDDHVGLYCKDIDLDSITHLRRLVELNLGDAELLERELMALG